MGHLNRCFLNSLDWKGSSNELQSKDWDNYNYLVEKEIDPWTGELYYCDPRILEMKANASDNPTWNDAMSGPDEAGFWDAC